MRITYDEEVDALYVRLKETPYHESDEIREGLILDYDESGNLIGMEIMDASDYLSPQELATVNFSLERASSKAK
ncbi:MAG: DUF2283 domain-containing protein [Dehalococcoidia bacterium]